MSCAWLALSLLAACRPFSAGGAALAPQDADGKILLGPRYLRRTQTLELRGAFADAHFEAQRIEVEAADDEIEVKAALEAFEPGRSAVIGGVRWELDEESELVDDDDEELDEDELEIGAWVKVEGEIENERLMLRKLELRKRKEGELEEVQGTVDAIDHRRREIRIGPLVLRYPSDIVVAWDIEGELPPDLGERELGLLESTTAGLRRVRRIDPEDQRPDALLTVGDVLSVNGEVRANSEWRENLDLDRETKEDRVYTDFGATLELSFDFHPQVFGFAQLRDDIRQEFMDEDDDVEEGEHFQLGEGYLLLEDLPVRGVALQLGRQDFDQGREWVMDEQWDAGRIYFNFDPLLLELSAGEVLFDPDPQEEEVANYLAALHYGTVEDLQLFGYALHRQGGTTTYIERTHFGVSGEGEIDDFEWWADLGGVRGKEDGQRILGFGADIAGMWSFDALDPEPYVFAGWAFGSGDDAPETGTDRNFRQTGLHDNNDRFGGVASFRYLGELLRPELSNLQVLTAGIGVRLDTRTSLDLVYHHYRQVESASFLRNTRLRASPDGSSRDLGDELDLVLGWEELFPFELELVGSYFRPGTAFGVADDPAWFVTLQLSWNF